MHFSTSASFPLISLFLVPLSFSLTHVRFFPHLCVRTLTAMLLTSISVPSTRLSRHLSLLRKHTRSSSPHDARASTTPPQTMSPKHQHRHQHRERMCFRLLGAFPRCSLRRQRRAMTSLLTVPRNKSKSKTISFNMNLRTRCTCRVLARRRSSRVSLLRARKQTRLPRTSRSKCFALPSCRSR